MIRTPGDRALPPTSSPLRTGVGRRRPGLLTAAALAGATALSVAAGPAAAAPAAPRSQGPLVAVIVEGSPVTAAAAVTRLGGRVDARLGVIAGLRARVPAGAVADLRAVDGVRGVTADGTLLPLRERWGDDTTGESFKASWLTGDWKADHDLGSAFTVARSIGAQDLWGKSDPQVSGRKLTGVGVGVALIDTGVAPVEGLATPGKLLNGPDLSFESQSAGTRYLDGFGHGTHMAGLIAGRDTAVSEGNEKDDDHFVGMAPDARIVNVKAGTADGGVDVSQVIAGIDWVVTNKAQHNIRVLNLSYGTDSTQPTTLDPLAHAVESAWRAGIVVVVAAGNDGDRGPRPLTMPAIDPYVIAVGSSDHRGSDKPEATRVGTWTNSGTAVRRPDLLAPGKSIVSLRVPGSRADVAHPGGRIGGEDARRMFRGTGTSQSAAIVSGGVALLLQRNPGLTPDQVKGVLKASADRLMLDGSPVQGAGVIDLKGAVEILEKTDRPAAYTQTHPRSTGLGSLQAARGSSRVVDPDTGAVLGGEQDIFGVRWDAPAWSARASAGTAWSGGAWRDSVWAGSGYAGTSWTPTAWTRRSWSGVDWSRRSWSSMTFLRRSWSGDDWSRRSWSGDSWSRRSWSDRTW